MIFEEYVYISQNMISIVLDIIKSYNHLGQFELTAVVFGDNLHFNYFTICCCRFKEYKNRYNNFK